MGPVQTYEENCDHVMNLFICAQHQHVLEDKMILLIISSALNGIAQFFFFFFYNRLIMAIAHSLRFSHLADWSTVCQLDFFS